jgi:hypothetical protein
MQDATLLCLPRRSMHTLAAALRLSNRALAIAGLTLGLHGPLGGCSDQDPVKSEDVDDVRAGEDEDDKGPPVDAGKPDARRDAKADDKPDVKAPPPIVPDDGENKCAGIRNDAPPASGGVDIVFLIDTSGSMIHAATQVQMNIANFVQQFEGSGADTRVVMITGMDPAAGTPLAQQPNKYRFISAGVDSGALFTVALGLFPAYEDFLRPSAATQFVMITDDNDAVPPPIFKDEMQKLLGGREFTQHAIASEDVMGLPCISEAQLWNPLCTAPIPAVCAATAIGTTYYSLADDTGGQKLSICKADWSGVFEELKVAVIAAVPLPCSYPLSEASTNKFDPDEVQVVYTPADGEDEQFPRADAFEKCGKKVGWYYDDPAAPSTINLCPTACETVANGGSMDIAFGCKPDILL